VTARAALASCAACLALAAPAAAQSDRIAPPGNAGVDEYLETIPGADGNRPSARRPDETPALSGSARWRLEALGDDGRAAAALADATAPPRPGAGRPATGGSGRPPGAGLERAGDGSGAVSAVVDRAFGTDDGGMGAALPLLLAASLAGAVALALARRRRRAA
jgi:hypothetical protein